MKPLKNVNGTKIAPHSSQILVSSGIPALDALLGGGIPVGTVAILEEDTQGNYAKTILKYFLAEGVVSKHSIFVASTDEDPFELVKQLPAAIDKDPEATSSTSVAENSKMKIAFRYEKLQTKDDEPATNFGHFYDLSKQMSSEIINSATVEYWDGSEFDNEASASRTAPASKITASASEVTASAFKTAAAAFETSASAFKTAPPAFKNPAYGALLESIKTKLKEGGHLIADESVGATILRIGIHSLGSPLWLPPKAPSVEDTHDLEKFLFCLRTIARFAYTTIFVTIPSHLYPESSFQRSIHASDIALKLQAFAGTELENNKSLSDYHGFFHITKLAAINSFVSKHPGSVEYVFKLRRKKFTIEKLHLPPDIGDEDAQQRPTLSCGSNKPSSLDF